MTYKDSIDWLFSQFPAYQVHGASAYKPDLDNILHLCESFGIRYDQLKYIHVAGTNGKGSSCNYLASILQEAGYKTGLFTSPHIEDFRERIRVNGQMISVAEVIDFCALIAQTELQIKPSFFEITWMLAIQHFIEQECQICVIETGLGGRLDATNIIHPLLTLITNIGMDHTAILGDSLEKIAAEKAGIMKAGVTCISGSKQAAVLSVFESKARELNCPLLYAEDLPIENHFFLKGSYASQNEQLVRAAIKELRQRDFLISNENVENGFKNVSRQTGFRGRFDIVSRKPLIIVDAAHNKEGIQALLHQLSSLSFDKLYVIYGASNDKNVEEILKLFPKNCHLLFCAFSNPRSLNLEELKHLQQNTAQSSEIFENIAAAFSHGQELVNEKDILLVTGSFFLLSDFFSHFSQKDL